MPPPLVSVILPVYNNAATLTAAARSILRQTLADLELIIIDDGSGDDSFAVAQQLCDPRIRLFRNESNLGVSKTRNRGIELMRGEFMAPMDADDICLPRRLELTVQAMRKNPALGVCGGWARWTGWGPVPFVMRQPCGPAAMKAGLLYGMPAQHDALLFRNEVLRTHHLAYDENLRSTVDFDLLVRCMRVAEGDNVPAVLVHYIRNPKGITETRPPQAATHRFLLLRDPLERLLPGEVDDVTLRRHVAIGNGAGAQTLAELGETRVWLETLEAANRVRKIFDPGGLRLATAMVWFRCCRNSAHLGVGAWQAWKRSPWATAYRPIPSEVASLLASWLLSRMVPARRRPQGHFKGLEPPSEPPCAPS